MICFNFNPLDIGVWVWVRTAVDYEHVRELKLYYSASEDPIRLPRSFYTCQTLLVLKLKTQVVSGFLPRFVSNLSRSYTFYWWHTQMRSLLKSFYQSALVSKIWWWSVGLTTMSSLPLLMYSYMSSWFRLKTFSIEWTIIF